LWEKLDHCLRLILGFLDLRIHWSQETHVKTLLKIIPVIRYIVNEGTHRMGFWGIKLTQTVKQECSDESSMS
jgi:hypothetical protein